MGLLHPLSIVDYYFVIILPHGILRFVIPDDDHKRPKHAVCSILGIDSCDRRYIPLFPFFLE